MKKDTAQTLLTLSREEYEEYAKEFSHTRRHVWEELAFVKMHAHAGAHVLDIGCGNGRLVDVFEGGDVQYTGIDFSKALIAIAQETRGTKGTFLHADALTLPFENNTFDTVVSIAVLHHIPSKEHRMRFASEAYRVLKPNGTCVLTVWNTLQWKFLKTHVVQTLKKLCGYSSMDFGDMILPFGNNKRKRYVHSIAKGGLRTIFQRAQFTHISVQEVKRPSGYANFVVIAKK